MNENRCVICGDIVPEGRQLCPSCWSKQFDLTAQKKQLVFICSPYRGETPDEVQQNTRNAEWYCRLAYTLGYIPFAPHLYFTRFLADNCETERNGKTEWLWVKSLCCSVRNCGYLAIK